MGLLTTLKIFRTQLNEHSKWAATIIDQSAVSASAFRARASKWVLLWIIGTFLLQLSLNLIKRYILLPHFHPSRYAVVRNVRKCGGVKCTHLYEGWCGGGSGGGCGWLGLCRTVPKLRAARTITYWSDVRYVLYNLPSICLNIPIKYVLFRVGNILIRVYIVRITKISLKQENVKKTIFLKFFLFIAIYVDLY